MFESAQANFSNLTMETTELDFILYFCEEERSLLSFNTLNVLNPNMSVLIVLSCIHILPKSFPSDLSLVIDEQLKAWVSLSGTPQHGGPNHPPFGHGPTELQPPLTSSFLILRSRRLGFFSTAVV